MNRCTRAVIYKDNLKYNLEQIKKYVEPGVKICVAVKADSYGHNAVLTSRLAQEMGIEFLAVATVDEAIELRSNNITAQILLLSLCTPEEMTDLFKYKITPVVFGKDFLEILIQKSNEFYKGDEKFDVHLAVDTGMGRIGCYPEEAQEQAILINNSKHLRLGGMITHFAVSDSLKKENQDFTRRQFEAFKSAVQSVKDKGINPGICSCGASAALLNNTDMHFEMVRPGIITYGYYPDEITKNHLLSVHKEFDIKPVLSFETKVVAIRHFPAGKTISYGCTYECKEDTDIAVLPVGYADGLLRRFSPGLEVTINGKNYPVRGRICMDQCMVEIGNNNPDVKLWDKAVIFGPSESGALNDAEVLAKIGNTISYEVLTSISKRVEKIIV
ncbi:MAG: alanine racemase [Treponema sp.]|nr:alanine racemase [Treponema sp.]